METSPNATKLAQHNGNKPQHTEICTKQLIESNALCFGDSIVLCTTGPPDQLETIKSVYIWIVILWNIITI